MTLTQLDARFLVLSLIGICVIVALGRSRQPKAYRVQMFLTNEITGGMGLAMSPKYCLGEDRAKELREELRSSASKEHFRIEVTKVPMWEYRRHTEVAGRSVPV